MTTIVRGDAQIGNIQRRSIWRRHDAFNLQAFSEKGDPATEPIVSNHIPQGAGCEPMIVRTAVTCSDPDDGPFMQRDDVIAVSEEPSTVQELLPYEVYCTNVAICEKIIKDLRP